MPFGDDDDDTDDDDLNSGRRGKQKASQSTSGDGRAAAGRSEDAQATAALQRDAMDAQIAAGVDVPDVNNGNFGIYGGFDFQNAQVHVYGNSALAQANYDQPGDPFGDSAPPDAAQNTPQAQCSTNNAEAGLIEDGAQELHRSEQASRSSEQLQVEKAVDAGDKKERDAVKARRNRIIYAALGLTGLAAILVPTLLKVFGVIGGGDSTPPAVGGGTKGDPSGPVVKNYALTGQNPNKPVVVNVPAVILSAVDATIDTASVALTSPDTGSTTRTTVFQAGAFTLDPTKGSLTFTPLPYFTGGEVMVGVTIANKSKLRSARAVISLTFDTPPLVLDQFIQADIVQVNKVSFNPLTGLGVDMGGPAVKGTNLIDPTLVIFRVPMQLEGGPPQQGAITITGGKTAVAKGEGTWTIDVTDGTILFVRDPGFQGSPTPLTYTAFDTKGIESNVGKLVITSYLSDVVAAITKLNTMDDDAFWLNYTTNVIGGDFGTLDAAGKIVAKLTLFRTVHLVMSEITRQSLKDTDAKAVQAAVPTDTAITASYSAWGAKGFDLTVLYAEAVKLSPVPNAVSGVTNGTRYLRLTIITKLLGVWKDALDAMNAGKPN